MSREAAAEVAILGVCDWKHGTLPHPLSRAVDLSSTFFIPRSYAFDLVYRCRFPLMFDICSVPLAVANLIRQGVKAAFPRASLSRLSVPVLKSMLQKNVRHGRAEAAVRCALELTLKSWNDAIRR